MCLLLPLLLVPSSSLLPPHPSLHTGGPGTPTMFDSDVDNETQGLPPNLSVSSLTGLLLVQPPETLLTSSPRGGASPPNSKMYNVKPKGEGTVLIVDDRYD